MGKPTGMPPRMDDITPLSHEGYALYGTPYASSVSLKAFAFNAELWDRSQKNMYTITYEPFTVEHAEQITDNPPSGFPEKAAFFDMEKQHFVTYASSK